MEKPPRLMLDAEEIVPASLRPAQPGRAGVWMLDGGGALVCIEDATEGPALVLVRSEHVLMLGVELPPMASAVRRRLALPYALEDRIADPLDRVHIALGAEIAPRTWLAGVVRHEVMIDWIARLAQAGLAGARLVPDALALPRPASNGWAVDITAERAVVRVADSTGFAVPASLLEIAWRAAGQPVCFAYGDPLPPAIPAAEMVTGAAAIHLLAPALDLRQGLYAAPRRHVGLLLRRIATVAALGAAAHAVIAVADTLALDRIAGRRDTEVRALAASVQPELAIGADLGGALADLTPDAAANAPSPFLSLLSRTGGALAGSKLPVGWRSAEFDHTGGTLTIEVETDSIADLQQVAQALTRAGLVLQPGAASTDQGRAVGTFAVHAS